MTRWPLAGTDSGVSPALGQAGQGHLIEADFGQRGGVAFAAAGVAVDPLDQLANAVHAVADDQRRIAAGSGDQLVADDQQAVVVARQVTLDEHFVADFEGDRVGGFNLLAGGQIDGHALALVAILRLDDHRAADFAGRRPGVLGTEDGPAAGTGTPAACSRILLSSLSWAIDSATALVRSVSAA
jgi:hypothetical protein